MKIYEHDVGHINKMSAKPIFDKKKKIQKSCSQEPVDRFHKILYVIIGTLANHSLFK